MSDTNNIDSNITTDPRTNPQIFLQASAAEDVTCGHPDKLADQISDAIVDAVLEQDKDGRVACETLVAHNRIVIAGEITSTAEIDYELIARGVISDAGYGDRRSGFDLAACDVDVRVGIQSPEIASAIGGSDRSSGAGDQAIVYGYATDETVWRLPHAVVHARSICTRLEYARTSQLPFLRPDGKVLVVQERESTDTHRIEHLTVSTQHAPEDAEHGVSLDEVRSKVEKELVSGLGSWGLTDTARVQINPGGSFVLGGPAADTGLTGRKLMVDTYGGMTRHGGGALSGKDPSKIDRTGAYAARWVAVSIITAGLARRCEVGLVYGIGSALPIGVLVDTFGTGRIDDVNLAHVVSQTFDLRPQALVEDLNLRSIRYRPLAVHGHVGRPELSLPWDQPAHVEQLLRLAGARSRRSTVLCRMGRLEHPQPEGVYQGTPTAEWRFPCMTCKHLTIPVLEDDPAQPAQKRRLPGKYHCHVCGQTDQYINVWISARANYHGRSRASWLAEGRVAGEQPNKGTRLPTMHELPWPMERVAPGGAHWINPTEEPIPQRERLVPIDDATATDLPN